MLRSVTVALARAQQPRCAESSRSGYSGHVVNSSIRVCNTREGIMERTLLSGLSVLGTLAVGLGLLYAQVPPLTPDDLTLRPGDTITWSPISPHRVQFGGNV